MGSFIVYIIKSALCLASFYLFYKLLLSKDTFHRFNRMALLGIFILSLLLPFAKLSLQPSSEIINAFAGMESLSAKVLQEEAATTNTSLYWVLAVVFIYLAGFTVSVLRQLISYFSLFRLIKKSRRVQHIEEIAVLTHKEDIAPFSWMHYILLSEKDYQENAAAILSHELAHIHNKHSWDLVLADLCIAFQWFNPAAWLFRQELQSIHEFEADDSVLQQGIDAKQYQLLIIKKAVGTRLYSMANSFNHSSLKNRIAMMLKEKSKPWARLKYFYVLPMACVAIIAFAHPKVSRLEDTSREKVNELLALAQTDKQNSEELSTDKINYILGNNVPGEVKNIEKSSSQAAVSNSSTDDKAIFIVEDVPGKNDLALLQSGSQLPETTVVTYGKAKDDKETPPPPAKKEKADIPPPPPVPAQKDRGEIPPPPPVPQEEVFMVVEEMPEYVGGEKALAEYISKSIRYPTKAIDNGISGRVICTFVIDSKGKVTNVQVIRSVDPDLDQEAVRVIQNMPDWIPGKQRGKQVAVQYTMPIVFKLQGPEPSEEVLKAESTKPENMPKFPGGDKALVEYINKELRYPKTALDNGIQGRVICTYVVNANGKITNIKVIRSVHPDLDNEAVRVIEKMPDWTPGEKDGKKVAVEYTLPIIFKLQ